MIEVMIEQWKNLDGSVDFLWSVWQEGTRVQMSGSHKSAAEARDAALAYCRTRMGVTPDAVTEL